MLANARQARPPGRVQPDWYAANTERHQAYMAQYRKDRPEVAVTARARARGADIIDTDISVKALTARDGWVCGVCTKAINPRQKWPSKWCAVIDHRLDIVAGGLHTWDNCQLAHRTCNEKKPVARPTG